MYGVAIQLDDKASPFLRALELGLEPGRLAPVAGESGRKIVADHLLKLSAARHRGDAPSDFYGEAAAATAWQPDGSGVIISIHKTGVAQRYFGGPIAPVNAARLAIPARSEAIGKRPREFSNLELVFFRETLALAERESSDVRIVKDRRKGREGQLRLRRGQERGGAVMFWLVERVDQDPDPTVLPAEETLSAAIYGDLSRYVERLEARRAGS